MENTMSRRAALLSAAVSTVALALPAQAMEPANDGVAAISIEELAVQFRDAAMKLDPRINECWIGYDELAKGPRDMRVMQLYFGRKDSPFLSPPQPRPATITDLFTEWHQLRVNVPGLTDAQSADRYERYEELQAKITSMRPRSVREAAIQLIVETDDGDSDLRDEFFHRLRLVALGEV